jgi:hypothetical protein
MAVLLIVLIGYGGYRAVDAVTSGRTVAARDTPAAATSRHRPPVTSSASPSGTAAPSVPSSVVIRLTAIEDCWVEFTSPAGQFISQAYVVGGNSKTWTFQQPVNMQIGNPGGIVLTVNGRKVGSATSAGQPVTLTLGPGQPVSSG